MVEIWPLAWCPRYPSFNVGWPSEAECNKNKKFMKTTLFTFSHPILPAPLRAPVFCLPAEAQNLFRISVAQSCPMSEADGGSVPSAAPERLAVGGVDPLHIITSAIILLPTNRIQETCPATCDPADHMMDGSHKRVTTCNGVTAGPRWDPGIPVAVIPVK